MTAKQAEIGRSALIIVDMQNDFLHPDGGFAHLAREHPEENIDMPFLKGTISGEQAEASPAGRLVVYVAHGQTHIPTRGPCIRIEFGPSSGNRTFIVENTWGAQIVDELKPREGEHLVVKKGFGGFSPSTPLDTVLRNKGVNTCVVTGVTTCVCVSTTVRGGVEHNYRMILVGDGVAEVSREAHDAELQTMERLFADVRSTDEVIGLLGGR
jgi:nicotinamidase-related amidase